MLPDSTYIGPTGRYPTVIPVKQFLITKKSWYSIVSRVFSGAPLFSNTVNISRK